MDNIGVESIIAQIQTTKTEERRVQTISKGKGNVNGKLGLSELLSKLLKAEIGASVESEYTKILDEKTTVPYEVKIQQIIEYVNRNGSLITSPYEIMQKYNDNRTNFINTTLKFNTNFDYKNWSAAKKQAEHFGYITFYIGNKSGQDIIHDENDSYYKNISTYGKKIIMNMGIDKMKGYGGMTSHLGVFFRATNCRDMPFGVFGHIKAIGDIYQIKPYGVWIS